MMVFACSTQVAVPLPLSLSVLFLFTLPQFPAVVGCKNWPATATASFALSATVVRGPFLPPPRRTDTHSAAAPGGEGVGAAGGAPGGAAERVAAFSVDVVTLKKWNNFTERTRRREREESGRRSGGRARARSLWGGRGRALVRGPAGRGCGERLGLLRSLGRPVVRFVACSALVITRWRRRWPRRRWWPPGHRMRAGHRVRPVRPPSRVRSLVLSALPSFVLWRGMDT